VIIHYLDIIHFAITPDEADSPLIVNPNAMLTGSVSSERLEAVARRHAQLLQLPGGVKVKQLTPGHALDGPQPRHGLVLEQRLRVAASKRSNQISFYDVPGIPSNGMAGVGRDRYQPSRRRLGTASKRKSELISPPLR
jgi:hypothetical protein